MTKTKNKKIGQNMKVLKYYNIKIAEDKCSEVTGILVDVGEDLEIG